MTTEDGPSLDERRLRAWRSLLYAHANVVDRIERDLAGAGQVPLRWYDVLVALHDAPGRRRRMNDLADAIVLSRSGLTRLVDRLEAAGLIRREPDPLDRRGAYVALRDAGEDALRSAWPVYARGIAGYFGARLSDDEAEVVANVMERIRGAPGRADHAERGDAGSD